MGTDFQLPDVFCFTDFLSGFLFRVRAGVRVKVRVRGGFRVRVRVRTSVGGEVRAGLNTFQLKSTQIKALPKWENPIKTKDQ